MARKNFAEILMTGGVDVSAEYRSLYDLVFETYGFYSYMDDRFDEVWFRDTCTSLDNFYERYEFEYEEHPGADTLDDLNWLSMSDTNELFLTKVHC
jgi:hypothetical protein